METKGKEKEKEEGKHGEGRGKEGRQEMNLKNGGHTLGPFTSCLTKCRVHL